MTMPVCPLLLTCRDDAADVVLADPSMLMPVEGGNSPQGNISTNTGSSTSIRSSRGLPYWAGGDEPAADSQGAELLQSRGGRKRGRASRRGGAGEGGKAPGGESRDAQAVAAAALDEIIKAESQSANRTRRSRSRKSKE